ncbi:hypothetical protein D3C72_1563250 [compost metagenome]
MRLAGIEDHGGATCQRDPMARAREMHVQSLVLAQEQVAEGGAAILAAVVVIPCAAAGHQGDIARGKHLLHAERACPAVHGLQAQVKVRPARARPRQGHLLYVAGFQQQARLDFPVPVAKQAGGRRRHVDVACQYDAAHAAAADGVAAPEVGRQAVVESAVHVEWWL